MLMRAFSAMGLAARTEPAKRGPRIICAPALTAEDAAALAPSGVPLVSRGMSSILVWPTSNKAICADLSMASPSAAFGPLNGKRIAILMGGRF